MLSSQNNTHRCRALVSLAIATSLLTQGCIQVHLRGPVEAAAISISSYTGGTVLSGNTTSELYWNTLYADFDTLAQSVRLSALGQLVVPADLNVTENRLYRISSVGGFDVDNNLNNSIDSSKTQVAGKIRAYIPGSMLVEGDWHISALTEAAYANVTITNSGFLPQTGLDEFTRVKLLKTDINGDGVIDYNDVLAWTPSQQSALIYPEDIAALTALLESGEDSSDWRIGGYLPSEQKVISATISGTHTLTATWGDKNEVSCSANTNIEVTINTDGSVVEQSSISNLAYDDSGVISCSPNLSDFASTSTSDGGVQFDSSTGELTIWSGYGCPFTLQFDGESLQAITTECTRQVPTDFGVINDHATFF